VRRLILVRHSRLELLSGVPASEWPLSERGRRWCRSLAELLAEQSPSTVVTSTELKAAETGHIVASILGVSFRRHPGLHEHERPSAGPAGTPKQFRAQVARLLEHPGELVFGSETDDQARRRFSAAMDLVLERYTMDSFVVVTHRTVLSLLGACPRPQSSRVLEGTGVPRLCRPLAARSSTCGRRAQGRVNELNRTPQASRFTHPFDLGRPTPV